MKELFSFSKLTTYHTCPYSYYLTYIEKAKRKDNVYSFLGTTIHSLLEELQSGRITTDGAKKEFLNKFIDTEILGYDFPTENSSVNFKECMIEYFENYTPFKNVEYHIEDYFEESIGDVVLRGYIDIYTIEDGKYIDVYDYKSSSKFTKKDLEVKKLQLIIYGIALKKKYPDKVIRSLNFDMCKYTKNKRGTLIERNKAETQSERAFVTVDFSDENVEQAIEFINDTYSMIKSLDSKDSNVWLPNKNPFFCKNICSHYEECPHSKSGRTLNY